MNTTEFNDIDLTGTSIGNGWQIERKVIPPPDATGSIHSKGYIAKHENGTKAFVKVLLLSENTKLPEQERLAELEVRIQKFNYEYDICEKCISRKMNRVVKAIESGSFRDDRMQNSIYYILFELLDSDLRKQLDLSNQLDFAAQLRVLQQATVGLKQLHWAQIAHQDVKPSNTLLSNMYGAKLGDFGNAHDRKSTRPGSDNLVAGDPTYAPLEQLYDYNISDWECRRLSADLYQLGSLVNWVFVGIGMTSAIGDQLRPEHHWRAWTGNRYEDVLPYLREAHEAALEELSDKINKDHSLGENFSDELVLLTRYLTDPDPRKRGHPKNLAGIGTGSQFGLERFESRFNYVARKAELIADEYI